MNLKHPGAYPFFRTKFPFIALFLILVLILPKAPKFGYEYKKGSPWKYETLYSQFDFPILKTEEQIQSEKSKSAESVIPYYKYSEDVVNKNLKAAESLSLGKHQAIRNVTISAIRDIYERGVMPDEDSRMYRSVAELSKDLLFIQKDKRAVKYPQSEIYRQSDAKAKLLAEVGKSFSGYNLDSIFKSNNIYDLIVPNLVFDRQTTQLVHEDSAKEISPTQGFVNAGQLIVSNDEIVTSEIEQMLDSYKVEYEANLGYSGPKFLQWLGNIIIALLLVLVLYLVIYFTNRTAFREMNKLLYILTIFLIATVSALVVDKVAPPFLFMVPFTLSALCLQAFFKNKLIITMYIVTLLPLLLFTHSGVVLFMMFLVSGFASMYAFQFFNRGWHQFLTAFVTFLSLLLTYLGFRLIDAVDGNIIQHISFLFVGSLLTVLGYPMIYLFEKMFNLVSNSRLMELADTANPQLHELETKAPGTFQHSLQVMNMADTVARALGANALLVRAGALYHDIGKINNPRCFIENESLMTVPEGMGYHANLSPHQSAKDIIAHVTDGLEMADRLKLPQIIRDFILTHHGTTCASYFYNKYINEGGDPANTSDFYYPGKKPQSKEHIILMLCDTVEAASRTVKDSTPEAYSSLVDKLVEAKMAAGQFDEADISLKELTLLKDTIKSYLAQLYHERVVYPKIKAKSSH